MTIHEPEDDRPKLLGDNEDALIDALYAPPIPAARPNPQSVVQPPLKAQQVKNIQQPEPVESPAKPLLSDNFEHDEIPMAKPLLKEDHGFAEIPPAKPQNTSAPLEGKF